MNATTTCEQHALELADIIDFKWLAAADGLRVHVERMQADPGYARDCLDRASASSREPVRAAALRLRRQLGLG
jgi:hypothetical protein